MELWIRSQDKECLTKVNHLYIKKYCGALIEYDKFLIKQEDGIVLAIYKTKERALEILDEIQNILNLKDMYKYDRELVLKSWENVDEEQVKIVREQMSVYEMPKE